ncbi:MAG TPA: hypothetical protein VIV14_12220 [Gammaproteobacteria bacterium]
MRFTRRVIPCLTCTMIVIFPALVVAQGFAWSEYVSHEDYFSVNFPGEPTVTEITYPTEYRIELPGRVYSYESRGYSHSATVIDYNDAIAIHEARNAACASAGGDGDLCQDDGPEEMRGAIVYASWNIMNREGADVDHYAYYNSDRVEGNNVRLTNPDGSRTSAIVHMHENRLYILESTVPAGAPAPGLFQISLKFLDREHRPVRYEWDGIRIYSNGYEPPPRQY